MEEDLVAVILVNYNGWQYCNECIDSLFKCVHKNLHVIVVDNESDEAFGLNEQFVNDKRVTTIFLKDNVGFAAANNIGMEYAINTLQAEYVLLLNNDTEVKADFLNQLITCSKSFHDQVVLTCKIYYFCDKNKLWYAGGEIDFKKGLAIHFEKEKDEPCPEKVNFASGCALFMHKKVIGKIGKMSEDYFLYYEDVDYSVQILNNGVEIIYCPLSVIYHKVNATIGTMSNLAIYYSTRNRLLFIKKYGINKFNGYISTALMIGRCFLKNPTRFEVLVRSVRDFKIGRVGRGI